MSLAVAARIARREMAGGLRGFRIMLACLALGVGAIAAVGSVRASIEAGLAREGATLLGGDAQVEFTYRRADAEERKILGGVSENIAEVIDFRSMAQRADGADRALTEVKAVDGNWPLYGAPQFDPPLTLDQVFAGQGGLPGAAMSPLLMDRLGLSPGDQFRLGDQTFVLTAALVSMPDNATAGLGLGPPTLVRSAALAGSGLIREGTLFNTQYRLKLPPGSDLGAVRKEVMGRLAASAPRWRDAHNAAPTVRHAVERLGRFLVLVGLAGLAVGGVGIASAVRAWLASKTETIATLKVLGAGRRMVLAIYGMQIAILTALGVGLGVLIGALLPILLAPWITAALPVPVAFGIEPGPLAEAALYGTLAAALFTLWPLGRAQDTRAAALYRGEVGRVRGWPRLSILAATALLVAALVGAAAALSGTVKITLWTAAGILGAFVALMLAGRVIRWVSRWASGLRALRGHPAPRMALASVGGAGNDAVSVVLSLGLGLTVLAAVGQIDNNLRGAIERELPAVAPSFFVLDIQPDQTAAFRARVAGDPGVHRMDMAPMLRGRITTINGRPAREVAGDHWVLRGDRGVTFSEALPARTRITAGAWWPEGYDGPPRISFSAEEAAEIGLTIGDTMGVNILGREIRGEVTSFRDVDFSSAGMGFIIAMNPSALAGAPHSWIATIYAERQAEAGLMRDLSQTWPNITVISVRDAIGAVTGLMGKVAAAITYGALMTLITGIVVLIGAAATGQRARGYEAAVLKTLGATRGWVLANFALRSALLGSAAGSVAVVAGGLAGWAVSHFVMETAFSFDLASAFGIVLGGAAVTSLASLVFDLRALSASPAQVLRARE